jgi:outer membrane protein assembly factor BamB
MRHALAWIACFTFLLTTATTPLLAENWPGWRGPYGNGTTDETHVPVQWGPDQNIAWRVELPAPGNSSPIVWDDRLFLTSSTLDGKTRSVLCFNRHTGRLLWQRDTAYDGPRQPTHKTNPYCSSTPVTDGEAVYAWLGSAGFVAYDFEGKPLWTRDLGDFQHVWGVASSPVLYDDTLILSAGPGLTHHLMALNKRTGATVWSRQLVDSQSEKLEQYKGSWNTPVKRTVAGQDEMVLALPQRVIAFNPQSGSEFWRSGGVSDLAYCDVLVSDRVITGMSGFKGPAFAMRAPAGESGDLTESHRLWDHPKNQQRIGSGIILGSTIYMINEPGVAQCIDAMTGEVIWTERLADSTWGSMVYVNGLIYITSQKGATTLLKPGPVFNVVAQNRLDPNQTIKATPAFSDGQIFVRSWDYLYAIGQVPNE